MKTKFSTFLLLLSKIFVPSVAQAETYTVHPGTAITPARFTYLFSKHKSYLFADSTSKINIQPDQPAPVAVPKSAQPEKSMALPPFNQTRTASKMKSVVPPHY